MRNNKGITIAALIVAIIGLSIGFAAFSNTLTIRSTATVNPGSENFVVKFSKVSNDDQTGSSYPITPIRNAAATTANITAGNGEIDSTNPLLLTGLSATFTAPGQSVSYKLYVRNTGNYTAYLTNLNFKNIAGKQVAKECTGASVTEALKTAACNDITVTVMIGGTDGVGGDTYTASNDTIQADNTKTHKTLTALTGYDEVYVTIAYAANNHYIDGDMTVTFGDIMMQYRSVGTPLDIPDPVVPQQSQSAADDLIPTVSELSRATYDESTGMYHFINNVLVYSDSYGMKNVSLSYNDQIYVWLCDSATASAFSQYLGSTFIANKWYNADNEGLPTSTIYTGSSPISLSDFTIEDSDIESYVTHVIASFGSGE